MKLKTLVANEVTILISSAGRRVELINCFRRAAAQLHIHLRILACDAEPELSAGCHIADHAFKVPPCDDPNFIDSVLTIVETHRPKLIVPTIDPELMAYSAVADAFEALGTRVHVSPISVIRTVRDKLDTMRVLSKAGVPVPRTADTDEVVREPNSWKWPSFLKPRSGSSSRGISIIECTQLPTTPLEPMILQELLDGPEYTVNFFVDMNGILRAAIPHLRIRVRGGEVEKAKTERVSDIIEIARGVTNALPAARGALCFQLIVDRLLGPKVIEINARFGGGYPIADYAGASFTRWLLEEITGLPISARDWREGVIMLRYDAAIFLN